MGSLDAKLSSISVVLHKSSKSLLTISPFKTLTAQKKAEFLQFDCTVFASLKL